MTAIARMELVPYALRFREPYVTARGRLEQRELLLLRLWTSDGLTGLGEAAPLALRGGPGLEQLEREIEACGELLVGYELGDGDPDELVKRCAETASSRQAVAAIEIAAFDLMGKLRELPVWTLLGADAARPVPCNATLSVGQPEAVAESALAWAERGFQTFKLKVGVEDDVEQVTAVREAIGGDPRIRIDANGVWSREQAVSKLRQLEQLELELVEQPSETLEDLAAVRAETGVPVTADESVASPEEARRAAEVGACDAATVKIAKVGGLRAALEVADELSVYLSSALDGPIGIAAAAHLAQALPRDGFAAGLSHGLATADLFEDTVASPYVRLVDASLLPSDRPGLGVEIDEGALYRSRLRA